MLRKLRTARALPVAVLALIGPAWALIGLSALALRLAPMRRLASWYGMPLGAVGFSPLSDGRQIARAQEIRRAIGIAARYAPFRADCLPQAMAGLALGRGLGVPCALHLGVSVDKTAQAAGEELVAHAWLISGPVAISGDYRSFDRFAAVGCWVSWAQAAS